jgi:leader peptidase (prepilin peptidase)/N-methyltransferase
MVWLIRLVIFYLGAIVGSFLNVCVYRMPRDESIVSPPSHCTRCGAPIKPYDNVPILSYLLLRGRCRACTARISPRYFIIETITACIFLCFYLLYGLVFPQLIIFLIFACTLIVVFFVDIEHHIIPDEISLGGCAFALLASALFPPLHGTDSHIGALGSSVSGLIVGAGLFWLIRLAGSRVFKKEAMGLGDVKLMGYFGAFLGWKCVLLTTFLSALIGSVTGISLLLAGKAHLGSRLPFGPFLCIGALLAFLYGEQIIGWYLALLHPALHP